MLMAYKSCVLKNIAYVSHMKFCVLYRDWNAKKLKYKAKEPAHKRLVLSSNSEKHYLTICSILSIMNE
jgi:hypothetical protein